MILKMIRDTRFGDRLLASWIGYRDQRGEVPAVRLGTPRQTPQTYS